MGLFIHLILLFSLKQLHFLRTPSTSFTSFCISSTEKQSLWIIYLLPQSFVLNASKLNVLDDSLFPIYEFIL